jgi:hypothetical protein
MRLRIAKKIVKAVGTPRESAYSPAQLDRALNRIDRTRDSRESNRFWHALMTELGPAGRAKVLAGSGAPAMAFDLLMRTPVEEWAGKPGHIVRVEATR